MLARYNVIKVIFGNQSIRGARFDTWADQLNLQLNVLFQTITELKEIGSVNFDGFSMFFDDVFAKFRHEIMRDFKPDYDSDSDSLTGEKLLAMLEDIKRGSERDHDCNR